MIAARADSMPRLPLVPALVLVAAVVLAYFPAIQSGGYIWDDDDHVTENDTLGDVEGLARIWFEVGATPQYFPLVHTGFWIQHQAWGLHPLGYHLVNVLLHAANALLVWLLLLRLRVPAAGFVAAVFALHPVHVESVAWVAEFKNVLSGLFFLLALLAWLRFDPSLNVARDDDGRPGEVHWGAWAVALVLYVAAVLSKTVTLSLPAIVIALIYWKRGRLLRRDLLATLPMFAVGLPLGLLSIWLQRVVVGATGEAFTYSPFERLAIAGRALWFYAWKILWPHPVMMIYPKWRLDSVWVGVAVLGACAVAAALWWWRGRLGRGPIVAVGCFVITLLPMLGFLDHYTMIYYWVADHFVYLASVPLIVLYVAAARGLAGRVGPRGAQAVGLLLLALLAVGTWRQSHVYRDAETVWRDTLEKNPAALVAHVNLGGILLDRGEFVEALPRLRQAVALDASSPEAHNFLGIALFQSGDVDGSIRSYEEALRLDPTRADALNNLGISLATLGRYAEAAERFRQALQLDPTMARAWHNLGLTDVALGSYRDAIDRFAEAARLAPEDPDHHFEQARALAATGRRDEAIREFREALRLRPDWDAALRELDALESSRPPGG